jgi:uncharacterized protein (DUF3084 family)
MKNLKLNGQGLLQQGKKLQTWMSNNGNKIVIILTLLVTLITMVKSFIPQPQDKLLKYKLEQLDVEIKKLKTEQENVGKRIEVYRTEVNKIDSNIQKIRVNRSVINNYYELKADTIKGMDRIRIINEFKKRYKY